MRALCVKTTKGEIMENENNWQAPKKDKPKVGLIERNKVNKFLFTLVSVSLVISVFIIILAIWGYVGKEFASKSVATLGTLIAGGIGFSWVNDYFGSNKE